MKRLTTVTSRTGKYEICKDDNGYFWAIEHKYIGLDGKLIRPVSGIQGHRRESLEEAIKAATWAGQVKEYKENNPNATITEIIDFMTLQD